MALLFAAQAPLPSASAAPWAPKPGTIEDPVRCVADPQQSYALFLPAGYSRERSWPVVYIFEPDARGSLPVEAMKDAAERYGFVLAGSNNSRNGPLEPDIAAIQAVWKDSHARLSIDDRRVYFSGFSGGARLAAHMAQACRCARGVLLNSAGFSGGAPPSRDLPFPVFATVGTADFNYREMVELDSTLDSLGVPHALRRFEGRHQWAPPEVWGEAFGWMTLLEMKAGARARDESLIHAEMGRALARAQALESSGEAYFALQDYRRIVTSFDGLADLSQAAARLAALQGAQAAKEGAKRERAEIGEERSFADPPTRDIASLGDPAVDGFDAWGAARRDVRALHDRLAKEAHPEAHRGLTRAHESVTAQLLETAAAALRDREYGRAQRYYELAFVSDPDRAWPRVSLARCLVALGDRNGALRELRRARDAGVALADLPARFPELNALGADPRFQELIRGPVPDASR